MPAQRANIPRSPPNTGNAYGISETCILGADAIFSHGFVVDGQSKRIFFSARRAWPSTLAGDFVTIGEKYVDSSTHYGNVPSHIKRRRSYRTIRKRILKEIGIKSFLGTIKENETYQIFVQNFSNYSILLPHGSILSSIDLHCQLIAKISDDLQVEFPSEHFIQTKIETPFVDPVYATSLLQLLSDFKDLFAEKNSGLGNTGLIKLTIDTQGKGPI